MSLKIILGASGYGKTYNLYNSLINESVKKENTGKKYILIVPEQSSLQAQKDIVRMHPSGGVFNIDVLTFGRLAYRIFEELGIELKETIDDTGKNLIVRKVLADIKNRLVVIKPKREQGFTSEIKSIISELKQYGITPDSLDEIIKDIKAGDRFKQKLIDINTIYRAFEEYIKDRFTTVEDKPEELLKVIGKSGFFNNAVAAFDGFTGFTPVQYRIFEQILNMSDETVITATIPAGNDYNVISGEEDLFAMSKTMIAACGKIADRNGISVDYITLTGSDNKTRFAKSSELDFLERELFKFSGRQYEGEVNDIQVYHLDMPKDEVAYTAAKISQCVREKDLRYRDISVVVGDMSMYSDTIIRIFTESGIPFFMDNKRSLIGNPLVEYIRAFLEIQKDNYSYESVFRFLKNGVCDIDRNNVDMLENYVIAFGIRGAKKWQDSFVRKYPGKPMDVGVVENTRKAFADKTDKFYSVFHSKESHVSDYVKAVYDLIEQEKAYEYMNNLSDELEKQALSAKAAEYRQTYRHIIELLDQINGLLGEELISVEEFSQIMDAGFEEIKVGIIPPSIDCVTVGDIERTRLEHVKVLFILGMNEGIIPKLANNKGILSEQERKTLGNNNVELSPAPREKVFIQNFYLYLNMTESECGLYLMSHKFGQDGKESRPSRIINMLTKMYPKLKVQGMDKIKTTDRLTNGSNSLHLVASMIMGKEPDDEYMNSLFMYFMNNEPYASNIRHIIDVYTAASTDDALSQAAAKELYSEIEKSSISRIETYAKCAFSHFAAYGLEIMERPEYELNNMDLGSVFHKAIELMSQKLLIEGRTFADVVNDEERKQLVEDAFIDATIDFRASYFEDSNRNIFMKKRIMDILDRTVWALGEQLRAGSFLPVAFEQTFSENFDGTTIVGKIDRIDNALDKEDIFVKVVDYKSGAKDIKLDEIYAGLKLQLMVYMKNTLDRTKIDNPGHNIIAAAALYNRIDNPIIPLTTGYTMEEYNEKKLSAMKPTGLLGVEGIEYLDNWESGSSNVIPAKKNKEGFAPIDEKTIFSDEQLKCLSEFAVDKMQRLDAEIRQGVIKANPYSDSCKYCIYNDVCGFDPDKTGYRKLEKVSEDEQLWLKFGYKKSKED